MRYDTRLVSSIHHETIIFFNVEIYCVITSALWRAAARLWAHNGVDIVQAAQAYNFVHPDLRARKPSPRSPTASPHQVSSLPRSDPLRPARSIRAWGSESIACQL